MGSSERRAKVLEAIVRDYVSTREPVGSRSIVERYDLGVSPATIRNDMAALEEAGLIHRPHTSAGRVPTDQGYRQFVDSLESIKPLSPSERRAMRKLLEGAVDLDDVVERAVRALAQVTRQVAVVQYPSLQRVSLRHVEVVAVGVRYVILLIVTEAGRVEASDWKPRSMRTTSRIWAGVSTPSWPACAWPTSRRPWRRFWPSRRNACAPSPKRWAAPSSTPCARTARSA